eukprot:6000238-Prymnesium_polylepis.1
MRADPAGVMSRVLVCRPSCEKKTHRERSVEDRRIDGLMEMVIVHEPDSSESSQLHPSQSVWYKWPESSSGHLRLKKTVEKGYAGHVLLTPGPATLVCASPFALENYGFGLCNSAPRDSQGISLPYIHALAQPPTAH